MRRQKVAGRRRQHQSVQRVLVGFEADVADEVRHALVARDRLACLPVRGIGDLLEARQHHRVEMVAHFDQDVLSFSAVPTIQVDNRVAGGSGACQEIQDKVFRRRDKAKQH